MLTQQILEKVTDFFDLVIDLTDFSSSNELPLAWLRRSMQICPPGVLPCINVSEISTELADPSAKKALGMSLVP